MSGNVELVLSGRDELDVLSPAHELVGVVGSELLLEDTEALAVADDLVPVTGTGRES